MNNNLIGGLYHFVDLKWAIRGRYGDRNVKKLLSLLLVALMLAPLCAAVPTAAADEVNITVDTAETVTRGTEGAQIDVRISASPRWGAIQATIEFDSSALCFAGFELNPELRRQIETGEPCIFGVNAENAVNGAVSFGYASAFVSGGAEGYYPGEYDCFGTLLFDVAEDAPLGFTAVSLTVTELSRNENDMPVPVAYSVTNGGITIVCAHDWRATDSAPATCEEDGYAHFVCSKCGDQYTDYYPATGHAWGEWEEIRPADCENGGLIMRVCANNPEHAERQTTDPLGHDWGEWETVSPATCVAKEVQTRVCARDASHTETREFGEPDAAGGHSWGEWSEIIAPTCTVAGRDMRVCANDPSHIETRDGAAPLGHDFTGWEVTVAPTCTEPGEETGRCSRCGALETREAAPLGHDWGEWETTTPATCAAAGTDTRVCKRDPLHTETRELAIDPEAHAWGEWEITFPATCETAAVETRVCANDASHTETREGQAALGHDYAAEVTDPTCTEGGYTTYTCTRCYDSYTDGYTDALGHGFGEWTETKAPSCTEAGEETRYCSRCDAFETRAVDALGHDWGEWETTTPATCAAAGTDTRVCKRDPLHTETRELAIDPEAHAWGEWRTSEEANCAHGELQIRVCLNDASHTESRETGEPIPDAHDWGEWEITKPVSVFEDGEETRVCKNDASHIETRIIPKPVYTLCDVDFDGEFTVSDALRALRIAAGLDDADELIRAAADADLDGEVTVADALAILRKAIGLVSE